MTEEQTEHYLKRKHLMIRVPGSKAVYIYDPQEDITVVELGECVAMFLWVPIVLMSNRAPAEVDTMFHGMSEGAKRHFSVHPRSQIVVPG